MTITVARWKIDDYHAMNEAGLLVGRQVELLNGLIIEMSPEGPLHSSLNRDTGELFRSQLGSRARVSEGKPITLINNSEPLPDIAIIRPGYYRESHPTQDDVYLAIEFSNSSLAKDLNEKRLVYAGAGIEEYWVVNLRDRQLIVFRNPINGDYQSEQKLTDGLISPLAFPDIIIEVNQLLN